MADRDWFDDSEENADDEYDEEGPEHGVSVTGLEGLDTDPGCLHPWYRLSFLEDNEGLACTLCMRMWFLDDAEEMPDAVMSIWQSAKAELSSLNSKYDKLAQELAKSTSTVPCAYCGAWEQRSAMIRLEERYACPLHIGGTLERNDVEAVFAAGVEVVKGWIAEPSLEAAWLAQANMASCEELAEAVNQETEALRSTSLSLPDNCAAALSLPSVVGIGVACTRLAEALDLDPPNSKAGLTYLLGLLACCSGGRTPRDAFPDNPTDRAIILMDLCRSDLPEHVEFTGDMADDIVRSIAERALDLFPAEVSAQEN